MVTGLWLSSSASPPSGFIGGDRHNNCKGPFIEGSNISCWKPIHLSSEVKMFFKYWFFVHKKYLYKANFPRRTRSCTPFLHPESLNPPTRAFLVHSRLKYRDFRNYVFPFLKEVQRVAHRRSQLSLRVSQCFHPFLKTTGASPPLPKTEP